MNQLFYNIAGGIEHEIRREKRPTYQKWLFTISELSKIGLSFISNFRLKVRVLYLAILKRKNLSLPLKVESDQFVICLVLPECPSVKICCISPSIVTALMPSLLFRCFSLFLPHSRTLAQEKRSEIVFVLGLVVGVSFLSILVAKYLNIFPHTNNDCSREHAYVLRILNLIARPALFFTWRQKGLRSKTEEQANTVSILIRPIHLRRIRS